MTVSNAEFVKSLVRHGQTIIWAAPQLDGSGNWLPEIFDQDTGETIPTGTWAGFTFPRWKSDAAELALHQIQSEEHVDILMAKEPRPAFLLLTGHGLDGIDLDLHAEPHGERDYAAEMRTAVGVPAAEVRTPTGGVHFYVASAGKHNESNSHSQCDYRGTAGLLALPGTRRMVDGEIVEYEVTTPFDASLLAIADTAMSLFDEFRSDKRRCTICSEQQHSRASGSSGIPLGDGSGWDVIEERPLSIQVDDPLWEQASPWDLADATLTWEELLAPWFNVVGRRESNLYLIRAGKAAENRQGKSAVLHCADNKLVVYSSDLPIQTGTQLSKLDVYCAVREFETPGEDMPEDFEHRMKWLRERWSAPLYDQAGLEVPRYLRSKCGDERIARAPQYPVLADEFWEAHPILKRIRTDAEQRGASPEGTLAALLIRVLLNVGHQVVLPPKFGNDPAMGATLNVGCVMVAPFGRGKGEAESLADAYLSVKHMMADMASGQTFSLAFGSWRKVPTDPHDASAPTKVFERNCWARYMQYDEMDRFKNQMGMQNSTLSPMLRTCLTSDYISERFAVNQDSRMPAIDGFRMAFVAHGQPERLDWLLIDEASGGFPQRLWYVYAESEMPALEYLDPDFEPEPIEPLDLNLPVGWEPADEIRPSPRKVAVRIPRKAKEQVRKWQWTCEDGDQRGMLTVRLKAYAAMTALMPELSDDERWELATQFHSLSFRTHQHVLKQLREAGVSRNRVITAAKADEQRALSLALSKDTLAQQKRDMRAAALALLEEGPQVKRNLFRNYTADKHAMLTSVLRQMVEAQEIRQTRGGYEL